MPKIYISLNDEHFPFHNFEILPESEFQYVAEIPDAEFADFQKVEAQFMANQKRLHELGYAATTWMRYDPEVAEYVEMPIPKGEIDPRH